MMNFLDLSTVSEEERRQIREILSDYEQPLMNSHQTGTTTIPTTNTTPSATSSKIVTSTNTTTTTTTTTVTTTSPNFTTAASATTTTTTKTSSSNNTSISSPSTNSSSSSSTPHNNTSSYNATPNSNNINNTNNNRRIAHNSSANIRTHLTTNNLGPQSMQNINTTSSSNNYHSNSSNHHSSNINSSNHQQRQQQQQHHHHHNHHHISNNSHHSSTCNNTTNTTTTGSQSVPHSAQMPPHMPGDMNSVIGMDMTSQQPPGYAIPPHVSFGPPPPHHVYGGPPIFQPYHYLIHPYNMPSYMPYVIAPNSVVPPRQQVPPQSSQPPNNNADNNVTSSHTRSHPRPNQASHHHQNQHNHYYTNNTNNNATIIQPHQTQNNHHLYQQQPQPLQQAPRDEINNKDAVAMNQGQKKIIKRDLPDQAPKNILNSKSSTMDSSNENLSTTHPQRIEKSKRFTVDAAQAPDVEQSNEFESSSSKHESTVSNEKPNNQPNSNTTITSTTNTADNNKSNNVITKNGLLATSTKNKNVVPNHTTRSDRIENQVQKLDTNPVQNTLNSSTTSQLSNRDSQLEKDNIKQQDGHVPQASMNGDEIVKLSSDEGFDTQSSLDVSKQSSTITVNQSKSSPENCNKLQLNEKRVRDNDDSTDAIKQTEGDNSQQRSSGGVWGSASSKSWADLFKRGGVASPGSIPNGVNDHNNLDMENGDNKNLKPMSNKIVEETTHLNNHVTSTKEQRSQEAAKRALDKMAPKLAQKISSINLKHSLPFLKPRGFINKGNGCYINATLQALIACPPFYNLMKEIGVSRRENSCTPILDAFAELFLNFPPLDAGRKNKQSPMQQDQKMHINNLQAEAIEPKCIYNVLGQIKSECLKGAQEDAEEFLSSVLNCLHEETICLSEILQESNNVNGAHSDFDESNDDVANDDNLWREVGPKNRSLPIRIAKVIKTPIQEIFGGSLFSIRTAGRDRCGHRSPFFDLQLDISGDNVMSVQDAIKSFTATEVIHDFYCSKTKQKLDAQRRTSLDQLPPILILHLKQFVYDPDHGLKKLMKKIEYPIDFELPEHCLHEKNSADRNLKTSRSYKLLAVVYHDGKEAVKGHYLTDVYHIGSSQWIRCDDSNLKVVPSPRIENQDSSRTPYLLFYRRLNTLRAQIGNHDNKRKG